MKSMMKKPSRGSLKAFSPREEDRGSTYLGMQSRKGAVPEASIRRLDRHFLSVVLSDPFFKRMTHEKEGPIYEVDHTSGKPTRTMIGEALKTPPPRPLRGNPGLEQVDEVPASFSLGSGPFSGLGRSPGAAVVFRRSPLHPSAESLTLWMVKLHQPLAFRTPWDLIMSLKSSAGSRFWRTLAVPTAKICHLQKKVYPFVR
jgi:hypothetical protein